MATGPSAILTDSHFQNLKNAQDQITNIQREIDLAKLAGLDVSQAEALLKKTSDGIRQIRQVYFPGR